MRKYLVAAVFAAAVAVLAYSRFWIDQVAGAAIVRRRGDGDVRQDAHDRPRGAVHGPRRRSSETSRFAGRSTTSSAGTRRRRTRTSRSRSSTATPSSVWTRRSRSRSRKSFASNSKLLGVVGPAGSQEVVASTSAYKGGGLGFVSGSASRTTLTDGHTDGNRRGYFFRTVPNDAAQGPTVANWMTKKLKWKRVYIIDDQETYSQGLADGVQNDPQRAGRQGHPRLDQPDRLGLLVARSRRSRATRRASTSRGSSPRRLRPSGSS